MSIILYFTALVMCSLIIDSLTLPSLIVYYRKMAEGGKKEFYWGYIRCSMFYWFFLHEEDDKPKSLL